MVFQTHSRRFLALLGAVLVSSTLSCRRASNEPQNEIARRGDDVLATGSMATIMDSVPGDAILASGDVSFGGVTGGDYLGAGGKQAITGRIHGSLRAAGGQVHVAAAVGLDSAAVIAKNAYLMGGTVQVDGTVRGALLASGGMIILNGVVGRDVEVVGGALRIGPHAQIAGNLRYRVPAGKVRIDPAARITGTVTAIPVSGRWGLKRVLWFLGFLMMGAVAVALFPGFMAEAAEILPQRPGRSALFGLGWAILVPIAICVAAITIVGLPLALLTAAIYAIMVCLATVPFAVWLGQLLLGARARKGREGALMNFFLGGFLLLVVGIIPIVGGWVSLVAAVLGLGTIVLQAISLRERQPV
jgi:cytoskeletal protein CcmA (bactofilin family)